MGDKIWVCATCSQHFTRKPSGKRHNDNLHSGNSMIVRVLDYMIGRITGQFLPGEPLLYRRKKKQLQQNNTFDPANNNNYDNSNKFGSKVIADSIGTELFCGNMPPQEQQSTNHDIYKRSSFFLQPDPTTLQRATIDANKQSCDPSEKFLERISKLAELKTLMSRYGSPEDINTILTVGLALDLNSEINDHFIYEKLAWFRKKVKLDESLTHLLSPAIPIYSNIIAAIMKSAESIQFIPPSPPPQNQNINNRSNPEIPRGPELPKLPEIPSKYNPKRSSLP